MKIMREGVRWMRGVRGSEAERKKGNRRFMIWEAEWVGKSRWVFVGFGLVGGGGVVALEELLFGDLVLDAALASDGGEGLRL